ncbi:hypothetical protein ZIOFF_053010 [Zingiber officinale]|uniref:Transcription factor CBF/NF-Y/archaeal histone domain-containing protein n=1 Tax=Zingiber officinale TaxID=94328 RepID=A0A8J5FHZ9_ZINOF|nr:hypothetical protein ZIOFF_053010 [Zingiber officinale]
MSLKLGRRTVQIPNSRVRAPIPIVSSDASSPASDLLSSLPPQPIAAAASSSSTTPARTSITKPPSLSQVPASPPGGAGGGGGSHESGGDQSPRSSFREQDRFLPIANISRIMKKALPANAKIAKDAKETIQECVSEFISFITSEASDKCQREKRKTINGDDLLWAMATLGFEDYIEPLKLYLQKYREGDSKVSAKGDNSLKQDITSSHGGAQSGSISQGIGQQGSFTQGMGYLQPQ